MNKKEVIRQVSEMSEINEHDCRKVLDALEEVIGSNIASSFGMNNIFNMVYGCMIKISKYKTEKNNNDLSNPKTN